MTKKTTQEKILKDFMSRVNKLTLCRTTSDKYYGTVTLVRPARGLKGYGTRKFSVSGSRMIKNGKYTLAGLRAKLEAAIAAR